MKLTPSDVNHLRRLLGYMRCEVGQSPQELVATVQSILPAIEQPSSDGKERLLAAHTQAQNVPKYVRAAIKALEKSLAAEHDIVEGELAHQALPAPSIAMNHCNPPCPVHLCIEWSKVGMCSHLCEGCPPKGYPTDKTRCAQCPRRAPTSSGKQP